MAIAKSTFVAWKMSEAAFEKLDNVKQCQLDCKSNCAFRPVASTAVLEFASLSNLFYDPQNSR